MDDAKSSQRGKIKKLTNAFWDVYDSCLNFLDQFEDDLEVFPSSRRDQYHSSSQQLREVLLRNKAIVLDYRRILEDNLRKSSEVQKLHSYCENYKSKLLECEKRLVALQEWNNVLQYRLSHTIDPQNRKFSTLTDTNFTLPAIESSRVQGLKIRPQGNDSSANLVSRSIL